MNTHEELEQYKPLEDGSYAPGDRVANAILKMHDDVHQSMATLKLALNKMNEALDRREASLLLAVEGMEEWMRRFDEDEKNGTGVFALEQTKRVP